MKSFQNLLFITFLLVFACQKHAEKKQTENNFQISLPFREGKLWGIASEKGEIICKPQYEYICFSYGDTNPNYLAIFDKGKWGVMDKLGKMILPIRFWSVTILPKAIVVSDTPDDKLALYDLQGNQLLAPEYEEICLVKYQPLWYNLLLIRKDKNYGLYSLDEKKIVLPIEYELKNISISNSDAEVFALAKNGKMALFNTKGKQVSDFKYFEYGSGGYARVQNEQGLWGIVDKNGIEVIPCRYKDLGFIVCNEIIPFEGNNGKWGYLNVKTGKEITKPEYDKARDFSNGYGEVSKNKKIGFVDTTGKLVVPLEYEGALNVQKGICFLMKNNEWLPIRLADNKPINKEKYLGGNFDFQHNYGYVHCKSDDGIFRRGIIDMNGNTIIPCQKSDFGMYIFAQNAVLQREKNNFTIFSLPSGKEIIQSTQMPIIEKDFMVVFSKGRCLILDLLGKTIAELPAQSASIEQGYILLSKTGGGENDEDWVPKIDENGNIVTNPKPLSERYVPEMQNIIGFISKDGKRFWKD